MSDLLCGCNGLPVNGAVCGFTARGGKVCKAPGDHDCKFKYRSGVVCVDSFDGRQERPCKVVGETPKRYRITVDSPTALPPGFSILQPGVVKLVPKYAVRFLAT